MTMQIIRMVFDGYSRKARLFPTLIIFSPIGLIGIMYGYEIGKRYCDVIFAFETKLLIAVGSGIVLCLAVVIWCCSFIIRDRGKKWEERIFRQGCGFPTTQLLMWKDSSFSEDFKQRLHNAIKTDFHISLPNRINEMKDLSQAERTIKDTVDLIRARVGNGRIVVQYNIQYGFARNTLASIDIFTIECACLSVLAFLSNCDSVWMYICIVVSALSGWIWLFRKNYLFPHANRYATTLLKEYYELHSREASFSTSNT